MNTNQKQAFIKQFCNNMRDVAVAKAKDMPDNWNGHELRKYMADKFAWEVTDTMRDGRSRRVRDYLNTRMTTNL